MVFGRKKTKFMQKKAIRKGRKYSRKASNKMAISVNAKQNKFFFTRQCNLAAINPTAGTYTVVSFKFQLDDLPNYSEFTNLFDQYKISAVKLKFWPRFTGADVNPPATAIGVSRLWSVIDYDDSATLTNENQAMEYQNCKTHLSNRPFSLYLKPCVLSEVYRTTLTTGYAPTRKYRIDVAQPNVPFYGVKTLMEPVAFDGQWQIVVTAKYYLTLYNPR